MAIINSGGVKPAGKAGATHNLAAILLIFALWALGGTAGLAQETNESFGARSERIYEEARNAWRKNSNDVELTWKLARACFDMAEFAATDSGRAIFANEGIQMARHTIRLNARTAAGHYYLGMNIGQLARTKRLGALKLVSDMEKAFDTTITLDSKFDYAGPHRCLGLLYRDAPGWPISVGNKGKARQHLTKAVQLSPEYPDNWLNLLEALVGWGEKERAKKMAAAAEPYFAEARKTLTGPEWQQSWKDWEQRWKELRSRIAVEATESPKGKE